ncbi:MAG: DUF4132 domain-containing protein [Granulosicoccus sp.]
MTTRTSVHHPLLQAFEASVTDDELNTFNGRNLDSNPHYADVRRKMELALTENLSKAVADFLTDPLGYYDDTVSLSYYDYGKPRNTSVYHYPLACFCAIYVAENPTAHSAKKLAARLTHMVENNFVLAETQPPYGEFEAREFANTYFFPGAGVCLDLVSRHAHLSDAFDLLKNIATGKYYKTCRYDDDSGEFDNYDRLFDHEYSALIRLLNQAHKTTGIDQSFFETVVTFFPQAANLNYYLDEHEPSLATDFLKSYQACVKTLRRNIIADLPNCADRFQELYRHKRFEGFMYVLSGLQEITDRRLTAQKLRGRNNYATSVRQLLDIRKLSKKDKLESIKNQLASFDKKVLTIALPHCGAAKEIMMEFLGMKPLIGIDHFIQQLREGHDNDQIYNCEDPTNGVIDLPKLLALANACDPQHLSGFLLEYAKKPDAPKDELMLVKAACDIERDKTEKALVRHGQTAIKAYGLYPVKDKSELQTRYLKFKSMHKEASQYGSERCANTRAAVAAGLSNLAQSAGFTDANRMEWALEADIADEAIPFNEWLSAGEWDICLTLAGITPKIVVRRDNKTLKSVPGKVRTHENYKNLRALQDQVKGQASRFNATLQAMMCKADKIEATELLVLKRLPVVATMLSQLILKDSKGQLGLYDAGSDSLVDSDGKAHPISGDLVIAHALDLFNAQLLGAWQHRIVSQRMVQPFKQAFRELYILTPAELDAGNVSMRFNGHNIDSAVGGRLFQSRGWSTGHQEYPYAERIQPELGITATIEIENMGHYFAENHEVTLGQIQFQSKHNTLQLADVDSLMFSETMRDVDLVASVAQMADSERWSVESALARRQFLGELFASLNMQNVELEDNHAYVSGHLAQYSVHLGSGLVHAKPGNYLCIIPASKADDNLYLPFSDKDLKTQEIISKILLLSNDHKITDPTILNQITPSARRSA